MTVEIITVGFEILQGRIVDTNAAHIARALLDIGLEVGRKVSVGDRTDDIQEAVRDALKRSEVIIMTGGLGPTRDDITKRAVADLFRSPLVRDPAVVESMRTRYRQFGYAEIPPNGLHQADVPQCAEVLPNPSGTAPGLLIRRRGRYLFMMPGVPQEMKDILRESIIPYLQEHVCRGMVAVYTLRTSGIGETTLADRLDPVVRRWKNVSLAYLPGLRGVDLRMTFRGASRTAADKRLAETAAQIRQLAGEWIYGIDEDDLQTAVAALLKAKKLTIAVAESCTGGQIASLLTDIPGSSLYFDRGLVTYSNRAKQELLKIPAALLRAHGAVSAEVAAAMAEGIRTRAGTDIGISVTGILGPDGGTESKPVGLVYGGYADGRETAVWQRTFGSDRQKNKVRVVQAALKYLHDKLTTK